MQLFKRNELRRSPEANTSSANARRIAGLERQCKSLEIEVQQLVDGHAVLLKSLNQLAMKGSEVVAEARGLTPAERRKLLAIFDVLHVPAAQSLRSP